MSAIILPVQPNFDAKKFARATNEKIHISKDFNLYGVGITDVDESYIDWKYTSQYRFK